MVKAPQPRWHKPNGCSCLELLPRDANVHGSEGGMGQSFYWGSGGDAGQVTLVPFLGKQEQIGLVLQALPSVPCVPVSVPAQHVLFMCFGAKLDFRCASRQALQSSFPWFAAEPVGCFMPSSSFLSHLINSQALQEPLAVMMLPALLASAFSQQSNLLRIEIFNLKVPQPVYGNAGEFIRGQL